MIDAEISLNVALADAKPDGAKLASEWLAIDVNERLDFTSDAKLVLYDLGEHHSGLKLSIIYQDSDYEEHLLAAVFMHKTSALVRLRDSIDALIKLRETDDENDE